MRSPNNLNNTYYITALNHVLELPNQASSRQFQERLNRMTFMLSLNQRLVLKFFLEEPHILSICFSFRRKFDSFI